MSAYYFQTLPRYRRKIDIETASTNSTIDPNSPGFTTKLTKPPALGLLNNKYRLHVIPNNNSSLSNQFTHRISYNTRNNAYYENSIFDKKYLKSWKKGCMEYDNIAYKVDNELDLQMVYLAREPDTDRSTEPGYIIWQFDYRSGNFLISSLNLRLKHCTFDDSVSIRWSISPLPTRSNPTPTFHPINSDLLPTCTHDNQYKYQSDNTLKDVSSLIKGEYGFKLKVDLIGGDINDAWQKTQLFRQKRTGGSDDLVDDDETFGFDVKVELVPDIVCDPLPEIIREKGEEMLFNDKKTSDFIISLEINNSKENQAYYVHKKILSSRSDYFRALLDSKMIESSNGSLILKDISAKTLEIILKFLYIGEITEITSELEFIGDWIDLIYGASRFLIHTLVQRCEKALKELVNEENVDDIEAIARECGAEQLIRYFEMLLDVDDEVTTSSDEDKNKLNAEKKNAKKITNIGVTSLRNIFRRKNKKSKKLLNLV